MGFKTPDASAFGGAIEAGVYQAKFVKYYGPKTAKYGDVIDAEFEIVSGEYEGHRITQNFIGVDDSKKLKVLVMALVNGEYEPIDLDDYFGTRVKIVVDEVEKDGTIYSNVTNVKPSTRQAPPKKKARPVVDDDEDFDVDDEL